MRCQGTGLWFPLKDQGVIFSRVCVLQPSIKLSKNVTTRTERVKLFICRLQKGTYSVC